MINYDEIKKIIENESENVDFGDIECGATDEMIKTAEKELCVPLPESYKWWLKNYGGGEVFGYEIYSIYEEDDDDELDEIDCGDIVNRYKTCGSTYNLKDNLIPVCETDEELFCFLVSDNVQGNEYPIYEVNANTKYADNFIDFLKKFICE
jgi:hypothetical protein